MSPLSPHRELTRSEQDAYWLGTIIGRAQGALAAAVVLLVVVAVLR